MIAIGLAGGLFLVQPCADAAPQGPAQSVESARTSKQATCDPALGLGMTPLDGAAELQRSQGLFAPNSPTAVSGPFLPASEQGGPSASIAATPGPKAGNCAICLEGNASVTWQGSSGSFAVDKVTNYRPTGTSGTLRLGMKLSLAFPVWGQTITSYAFSDYRSLDPLAAGYYYSNVTSGTTAFHPNVPDADYYMRMSLDEYQADGSWPYVDFVLFDQMVSCRSGACSLFTPSSVCIPNSQTLCLLNNRLKVQATYRDYGGTSGVGLAKVLTADAGYFYFFDANNVELVIKAVSFCSSGGTVAIYASGLTDVQVLFKVLDVKTGIYREYPNALGHRFTTIGDGPFPCGY